MLYTDRTTFPIGQSVAVPCYRIDAFDGKNLTLTPEAQHVEIDFALFDARSINDALILQREDCEIHGLMALDARAFANAFYQAATRGNAHKFGAIVGDAWYFINPIEPHFSPRAGGRLVVGLYR